MGDEVIYQGKIRTEVKGNVEKYNADPWTFSMAKNSREHEIRWALCFYETYKQQCISGHFIPRTIEELQEELDVLTN